MILGFWVGDICRSESFPCSIEIPSCVTIILLVEWVCCIVASPIQTTIIVPNGHNVLFSSGDRFGLAENLTHQCHKIFSGISIDCCNFITLAS